MTFYGLYVILLIEARKVVFLFYKKIGKGDSMSSENKKIKKESVKKEKKDKKNDISFFDRLKNFCLGVKQETKRVHWTTGKDIVRYSVATFIFVLFFSLFFYLIDVLFALVHSLVG